MTGNNMTIEPVVRAVDALARQDGLHPRTMTNDELIGFACLVYGDSWRDDLSSDLAMDRRTLTRVLASPNPISLDLLLNALTILEQHLERDMNAIKTSLTRLAWLKAELSTQVRRDGQQRSRAGAA